MVDGDDIENRATPHLSFSVPLVVGKKGSHGRELKIKTYVQQMKHLQTRARMEDTQHIRDVGKN